MPTSNKLLGICIPAYHRPKQLERCVLSAIAAAKAYSVPIFITDDADDSANQNIIEKLKTHYPLLIYHKNPHRLGLEHNILHAAAKCTTEYCWLLGEDDRMEPNSVAMVLHRLQTSAEPPPFLFVNYRYVNANISRILRERVLPIQQDLCVEAETFLQHYGWAMGFIGSCVFQHQILTQTRADAYIGTYYAHVGVIMQAVAGKTIAVLSEPLVRNRVGDAWTFTWTEHTWNVFKGWDILMDKLAAYYPKDVCQLAKQTYYQAMGIGTLRFLCSRRADRVYSLFHFCYEPYLKTHWKGVKRLGAFLIALAPPQQLKFARIFWDFWRERKCRSVEDIALRLEDNPPISLSQYEG